MLDMYQREELQPSWSNQLDVVGMQPHAREYLENELNYGRSMRKFEQCEHQTIDYPEGIHFGEKP